MSESDWLEGDIEQKRREQEQQAIEDAQIYLLFVDNERGRELLRRWDRDLLYLRTPPDSNVQQYAADEALRAFVARIHQAIEMAQKRQG